MSRFTLYQGNCLDALAGIPDGSIDAVITDPPYFMGLTNNGQKADFSNLEVTRPFWKRFYEEVRRIIHPEHGAYYQFECWRSHGFFMPLMNEVLGVRNTLIWNKISGPGNFYTFQTEFILFWTNDRKFRCKENGQCVITMKGFSSGSTKDAEGEKLHPAQKPLALMKRLILDSTEPDALVCDPFMGSGSTGAAALETGRRFIGIELQEKYFEVAKRRLDEVSAIH